MVFLMWAIGFGNASMLWWLLAAAAPIALHLWRRPARHREPWAAMSLLSAAIERQTRQARLWRLAVLAARVAAVSLIAIAAAEPLHRPAVARAPGSGRTHYVLVIDCSYSMDFRSEEGRRLDRAVALARRLASQASPADLFSLVAASAASETMVTEPTSALGELAARLDAVGVRHSAFDLPAALTAVERALEAGRAARADVDAQQVVFFTDLQRGSWAAESLGEGLAPFQQRMSELGRRAAVRIVDVAGTPPTAENTAVTAVQFAEATPLVGRRVRVRGVLKQFGRRARPGVGVELWVDGRVADRRRVDLEPGGETAVDFAVRFDAPGDHLIEVRSAPDNLPLDDQRAIVAPVRTVMRVLCVEGRPDLPPRRQGGAYLASALAPGADDAGGIAVDIADESALTTRDLDQYDCVVLSAVGRFSQAEAAGLARYVRRGGGMAIFVGEGVSAERYNRRLGSAGENILPMDLGPTVQQPPGPLDAFDFRHPIVKAFSGRGRTALLTTPIETSMALLPVANRAAEVVLAHAGGEPLVAAGGAGRGRVVLVGAAADVAWGGLPLWPSFVPLVHEIVLYCSAGRAQRRNVLVGQSLAGEMPTEEESLPRVVGPDAKPLEVRPAAGDARGWSTEPARWAGEYSVRFSSGVAPLRYAAALDPRESDLTRISADEAVRLLGCGEAAAGIEAAVVSAVGPDRAAAAAAGPAAAMVLVGVLLLLSVEAWLTWRTGRPRA